MAYLLDTHAFLWWLSDDARLPEGARALIRAPENAPFVSAVTGWEIAIKKALHKCEVPDDVVSLIDEEGFQEMPTDSAHGQLAGQLPAIYRDPFDRVLVAQCQEQGLTLLTQDETIPRYDVKTYWG